MLQVLRRPIPGDIFVSCFALEEFLPSFALNDKYINTVALIGGVIQIKVRNLSSMLM